MSAEVVFRTMVPLVPAGPDLGEGLRFYTEGLGFTCLWAADGHAGLNRGGVGLILVESADRHWAENASFGIGVEGLDALYEAYKGVNARVGPLEIKPWGRREFHMIVPSGVCLQFFESGEDA